MPVGLGVLLFGGLGCLARYLIGAFYGTSSLLVNISGSFLLGLLAAYCESQSAGLSSRIFLFLGIGFLGGFTTFSSFSLELLNLTQNHSYLMALTHLSFSLLGALAAVFLGYSAKFLF